MTGKLDMAMDHDNGDWRSISIIYIVPQEDLKQRPNT